MIAKVVDDLFIYFEQISPHEEDVLWRRFSVARPGMQFVDLSGMNTNWDGVFRFYNKAKRRMARPLLSLLRKVCQEEGLVLKVGDLREPAEYAAMRPDDVQPDGFLPGIVLDPWQLRAIRAACAAECGIVDIPTGGGKCLGKNTPVLMYDMSTRLVQDVRAGDLLMGDDGTPRTVIGVCSGVDDLYEVRQKNGQDYVVNSCHVLSLMRTPDGKSRRMDYAVVDVDVQEYLGKSATQKHILKGYKVRVDLEEEEVPYDPYAFGVWLGDGISADCTYVLNDTTDAPIVAHLEKLAKSLGMELVKYPEPTKAIDYYAMRLYEGVNKPDGFEYFQRNPVRSALKRLKVLGNKHVPLEYIVNSRRIRLEVLAGVLDADGYTNDRNDMLYLMVKRGKLPDTVAKLARSLGFRVTERDCWKTWNGIDGDWYRRLTISGDLDAIPLKLPHKSIGPRRSKKNPLVCGIKVVPVGRGEYYGFQLDGNKRFLLGDFTVTHNTEVMAGICKAIPCPTIILADQTVVVEQTKDRLRLRQVAEEIGMFYAGKRPGGDELIVVGSIQSLQLPSKPPDPPTRGIKDTDSKWKVKLQKYDQRITAYKTRIKNAKWLRKVARQAHMAIVDECVHEDSWISTDRGVMPAKTLERLILDGVKVSALVGDSSYPITAAWRSEKEAVAITTSSKRRLVTSSNHKFAVLRGLTIDDVYAADLLAGDLLLTPRVSVDVPRSTDFERWRHAGLFIGDGHFMRKHPNRVRFAVRKDLDDWRDALRQMAESWGGEVSDRVNKRGDLVLSLDSPKFCGWLKELGFNPGRKMGRMHIDLTVPSKVAAAGLLRGLFDAEGTAYPQTARFAVTDQVLTRFVQQLLSYLGIGSSVSFGARKNPKHLPLWRANLSGENYSRFLRTVGFGFSRKLKTYTAAMPSDRLIDPRPHLRSWLACGLMPTRLKKWLGVGHSMSNPPMISLSQLVEHYRSVKKLAATPPSTYADARYWYGVADSKVAAAANVSTMTSWNRRARGDDSLWRQWVDDIRCKLLSLPEPDGLLDHYAVEAVSSVTAAGVNPLLDFSVESANRFEANGLLVHNCDRAASNYYKDFFRNVFRGRRRYGVSGTPFEPTKPVECMVIRSHLGDVIARESRAVLEANKRIIPIEYYSLVMDGDPGESSAYDIAYKERMTESPEFWKVVAGLCKRYPDDGTLILVDKEALGDNLRAELAKCGIEAHFIYGKTPKKKRTQAIRAFEERKFKVLIGGKIIGRGLDLKGGCENLIIATGGQLWSDFNQKIGRAVRHNSRGKGRVFDFFFRNNKYLYKHSRARLTSVVGMGYKTTVVFPQGKVDGAELIKSKFRLSKKLFERRLPLK